MHESGDAPRRSLRSRLPTTAVVTIDDFGDYDRDALLDASLDERDCYYSAADDECYDDLSAVHADHTVALAEAWRSGLPTPTPTPFRRPRQPLAHDGRPEHQQVRRRPAAWLPDNGVCSYITAYVEIKLEYELTIDQAEHDALTEVAADC